MDKPSDFTKKVIKALWETKKSGKVTQVNFAAQIGVKSQGLISDWTKGVRAPEIDGLIKLARGFGVPAYSLLPPEPGELGKILDIIADLDPDALAFLRPYVDAAKEMSAARRTGDTKKSIK